MDGRTKGGRVMSQQQHIPVWDLQRDCYVCPADGCGETFSDHAQAGEHAQDKSVAWKDEDERQSERDEQRAEDRERESNLSDWLRGDR
jgi:predicted NBD/HSP70 family sugar kinase